MKSIKPMFYIAVAVLFAACTSKTEFPISDAVPAAEITAKKAKQGKTNYLITLNAINLASPERLTPPKKFYVIWAVSESGVTRNVGYFINKNAESSTYKASFPYEPVEVFITAEDEEGLCKPNGLEIGRVKI